MYIAFRWLVSLAFIMWFATCLTKGLTNMLMETNNDIERPDVYSLDIGSIFKNDSVQTALRSECTSKHYSSSEEHNKAAYLHLIMFIAGALVVLVHNKKQQIIKFTKGKFGKINISGIWRLRIPFFKYPAIEYSVDIAKYFPKLWTKIKINLVSYKQSCKQKLQKYMCLNAVQKTQSLKQSMMYCIMLKKLKDIAAERRNLGNRLTSAIQENKKIRTQCQLETLSKNRLSQHIENTNKKIKENKSRYVSFQQLYLVTHQENIYLKTRIRKLIKEKENAVKNLMEVIYEVYKTKNVELKSYCSRYLVNTKNNLLNSDVNEEIETFLRNTRTKPCPSPRWHENNLSRDEITNSKSWLLCTGNDLSFNTNILQSGSLAPFVSNSPKLKGLPGECVWTVKDKDGIIEKLYEYDYESGYDNSETVQKIRQYSVYHDKDCLLDFSNSLPESDLNPGYKACRPSLSHKNGKSIGIVTDSVAFKKFLCNSKGIGNVPSGRSTAL